VIYYEKNLLSSIIFLASLFLFVLCPFNLFAAPGDVEIVSIDNNGSQGNDDSYVPSISSDGRYVAFESSAINLVPNDTNGVRDVFVYNRDTNTIERVSIDNNGTEGNGGSYSASISPDGRYVAFESSANNLVPGDSNNFLDIFVYDRQTNTIERVSVADNGTQSNNNSDYTSISFDGRYITFQSQATNLVPGDTNGVSDIFVYDRQNHSIERVSIADNGTQGDGDSRMPSISYNGRYVTFSSFATNLVPGDTNGAEDIFVYDRQTGAIEKVSISNNGIQGNSNSSRSDISSDGRYVVFESWASNLVPGDSNNFLDIFVYDRQTDTIERVSLNNNGIQGDNNSSYPSISSDGRYVAFESSATNLVNGDTNGQTDIFVYDRHTNTVERVSVDSNGTQGDNGSYASIISLNGRFVAFDSIATNLVSGDTNGASDIFVKERALSSTPENVPSLNEYGIILFVLLSGYFAFRKLTKEV
jgi:Tol biopolymer transport system component